MQNILYPFSNIIDDSLLCNSAVMYIHIFFTARVTFISLSTFNWFISISPESSAEPDSERQLIMIVELSWNVEMYVPFPS